MAEMTRAAGRGRLAYAGWNLLLGLPFVLVSAFPPALRELVLSGRPLRRCCCPSFFGTSAVAFRTSGWDASGGKVLLWMLGSFVPILNLVLGLTLLFTPGRQSQAVAAEVVSAQPERVGVTNAAGITHYYDKGSEPYDPTKNYDGRAIVAPATAVPAAPTVPASSVESARLRQLQGFHAAGLITTAEYEAKKTDGSGAYMSARAATALVCLALAVTSLTCKLRSPRLGPH